MNSKQLSAAFDKVIETYKEEATEYTKYCPEEMLYALEHLYKAQLHALESIRGIIVISHE